MFDIALASPKVHILISKKWGKIIRLLNLVFFMRDPDKSLPL